MAFCNEEDLVDGFDCLARDVLASDHFGKGCFESGVETASFGEEQSRTLRICLGESQELPAPLGGDDANSH